MGKKEHAGSKEKAAAAAAAAAAVAAAGAVLKVDLVEDEEHLVPKKKCFINRLATFWVQQG